MVGKSGLTSGVKVWLEAVTGVEGSRENHPLGPLSAVHCLNGVATSDFRSRGIYELGQLYAFCIF